MLHRRRRVLGETGTTSRLLRDDDSFLIINPSLSTGGSNSSPQQNKGIFPIYLFPYFLNIESSLYLLILLLRLMAFVPVALIWFAGGIQRIIGASRV